MAECRAAVPAGPDADNDKKLLYHVIKYTEREGIGNHETRLHFVSILKHDQDRLCTSSCLCTTHLVTRKSLFKSSSIMRALHLVEQKIHFPLHSQDIARLACFDFLIGDPPPSITLLATAKEPMRA